MWKDSRMSWWHGRQRTTCTAKTSLTSCQAHAFCYKESSTASSSELNVYFKSQKSNSSLPRSLLAFEWRFGIFYVWLSGYWLNGFEACSFNAVNHLLWAYVQILLRDALRHLWPLNENVPVFDTLSRICTGSCYLFDLASFGTNVKLTANLVLPHSYLDL